MEGFDPKTSFGYDVSKRYDALEFAVGTGRIALPLTRAGVRVDGIELSTDMVDRMREKPGGGELHVVIGDTAASWRHVSVYEKAALVTDRGARTRPWPPPR